MKKLFTENMWLKIASLAMAVALWFFVTSKGQSELSLEVPIGFRNIPSDLVIVRQDVKTLTLRLEGHERLLKKVNPSNVHVFLDMSRMVEKENMAEIRTKDVSLPSALRVTYIEPSSVRVYLEKRLNKTIAVSPALTGVPAKGFRVSAVEVSPKEVIAEGAKSALRKFNSLETEPLDITNASETVIERVRVDKAGRDIKVEPEEVTVKAVIIRRQQ